jgi:shikimate dehydrogenase
MRLNRANTCSVEDLTRYEFSAPTVLFVGVSTAGSQIHQRFPAWTSGTGLQVVGVDIPHAPPLETYRFLLTVMRDTSNIVGAVVTSHKVRLLEAASDLFAHLDTTALAAREVNAIHRAPNGDLHGAATDPIAVRLTLEEALGTGFTQESRHVVCLGAGGAAIAILLAICDTDSIESPISTGSGTRSPTTSLRFDVTDTRDGALRHFDQVASQNPCTRYANIRLEGAARNDEVVTTAPLGSLIVNATGMGKDQPGSPIAPEVIFPKRSRVWELNYRGNLSFLRHAQAQQTQQDLEIYDGWRYFLYGWQTALRAALGSRAPANLADLIQASGNNPRDS